MIMTVQGLEIIMRMLIVEAVKCYLVRVWNDRRAVTALEYGLIASLVAVTLIAGATSLGTKLKTTFSSVATAI